MAAPASGLEILVPTVTDVIVKYTWTIDKYARTVKKRESLDSPSFEHNANGIRTRWNVSIRFWKGPDGKRVRNPVVVCLNLLGCAIEQQAQARVRYQFGVYNADVRRWELCDASRVALNLETSGELLSVGYRDLSILDRHESRPGGHVSLCVKIQLAPTEADDHTLSRDLSRVLGAGGDVTLRCEGGRELRAHAVLLGARSGVFAALLERSASLDVTDERPEVMAEVLRYVYTDHADGLDATATATALLAAADRFDLPGLKVMCERALLETISSESVASLLLLADRHDCAALKRALLAYCEDNVAVCNKSLAWRVMELVNPELFVEVCEAGLGSSMSSDLESITSDSGVAGL